MTIAIIGRGAMGVTHARAWASLGQQVAYVCATSAGPALPEVPDARIVSDLQLALDDPRVDIVSICTPTLTHAEFATRALRAGKHVLLEKPIALSRTVALDILREAQASDRVLMVAHVVRFFDGYQRIRAVFEAGEFGDPVSVRAHRMIADPQASSWWYDDTQSGGVVVDVGIHDFDQLNLILGEPERVRSTQTQPGGPIETTIEYAGGGLGQVLSFAGAPPSLSFSTSLEVVGSKGVAEYRYRAEDAAAGRVAVSELWIASNSGTRSQTVRDDEPYARQAEYFLDCVRASVKPDYCPTESAILALDVALAARASLAQDGGVIRLAEQRD